ncbi:VENN motif pre-toxin domain-containing protein, partial [Cupriavidus basilensis]|uniref:VENN motif pre-toxin domain-containing protein n=1 Tax=Cupriavidus basilensis TaxID=68895 RepID=UPI0020C730F1
GGTADKNSLSTGTLTISDIENRAEYKASSVSLGGGYSQGKPMMPLGGGSGGGGGVGLTQGGQAATGEAVPGTNLPTGRGNGQGASFAPPIVMAASGSASSTTASGISAGNITIRDEEKQKALTGKDAAKTIASLNRETDNTANALKPIFNEKEIRAGFGIVGALQREAGGFLNNRAREADAARKAAEAVAKDPSATPEQRAEAQQRADDAAKWGQGGTYRQVMTALTAAAGGNVTGSAAQFAQGAAVGYIQGLAAGQVKAMADSLGKGTPAAESARAALHAIVGCAGAAAASQACGAGAMGAAASSVLGSLLAPTDKMPAQEKQAREDMVRSLVAGVAGAAGGNAATAVNAATFEVENNQLSKQKDPLAGLRIDLVGKYCGAQMPCSDKQLSELIRAQGELSQAVGKSATTTVMVLGVPVAVTAAATLVALAPEMLGAVLANPAAAVKAGIITAETAAAIATNAVTPGVVTEGATAQGGIKGSGAAIGSAGREIKIINGFYESSGSSFKFSQYYYDRLWSTGRGAPFVQAEEVLKTATNVTIDRKPGFYRYANEAMEMVYNPETREVWHLQPINTRR